MRNALSAYWQPRLQRMAGRNSVCMESLSENEIETLLNKFYGAINGHAFYALYKGRSTVNSTRRPLYVIKTENFEKRLEYIARQVNMLAEKMQVPEPYQEAVWTGITSPQSEAPNYKYNHSKLSKDNSWKLWGSPDSTDTGGPNRMYRIANVHVVPCDDNVQYSYIISIQVVDCN